METTREKSREESHKNLVNNLQELLEKNYDAERGFKKALEDADSHGLKEFLKMQAVQRNRFATELDKQIRDLNEEPKENGSASGSLHRAWIDIKTAFTGKDDEAVLEECIRGEKASVEEYEDKLKNNHFPVQTTELLDRHLVEIRATLSEVRSLEDLADRFN